MAKIDEDLNELLGGPKTTPTGAEPVVPREVPDEMKQFVPSSPEELLDLDRQAELQRQYGHSPIESGVGEAISEATFGLSDQVLRAAGVSEERLREVRERNPTAATVGAGVGIVAPALLSGGTTAAAKVVSKAPINLALQGGLAVERAAASLLKNKVRSKAVQKILPKIAAGMTEGAAFGAGHLISENALGKADFNGENLIASAGAGAALGAGFGALAGSLSAAVPFAQKSIAPASQRIKESTEHLWSPASAAEELVGPSLKQRRSILAKDPKFFDGLAPWMNEKLEQGALSTPKTMLEANEQVLKRAGAEIGEVSEQIAKRFDELPALAPTREETYMPLLNTLKQLRAELAPVAEVSKDKLDTITGFDRLIERHMLEKTPFNFKQFEKLRKDFQKMKWKFGATELTNNKAEIANLLRAEMRNITDGIAEKVSTSFADMQDIAARLKAANKDYHVASTILPGLERRVAKGSSNIKLADIVEGAALATIAGPAGLLIAAGRKMLDSDIRRNLVIMTDIQRQKDATLKLMADSLGAFFKSSKKPAKALSLKALTSSGFAMNADREIPSNRQKAFNELAKNINGLAQDPEVLIERLAKSSGRIGNVAPNTAMEAQEALVRGIVFLSQKLPRPADDTSSLLFPKDYKPSDAELAKFERYLQVVEHPMSVLKDLEHGTLTREHVEALKAVYPALYGELQQQASAAVAAQGDRLPYSKRVQLGILLDIPTDESMQPQSIADLQNMFNAAAMQQATMGGPARRRGRSPANVGFASRSLTETQRVSIRKMP